MLVKRKEDWELYSQETNQETLSARVKYTERPNIALRAKFFITVILLSAIAIMFTVQSEAIIRAGYNLVQTKAQLAKVEKENQLLRLDIAKLKSPQRIKQIATSELGMVIPNNIYYAVNEPKAAEKVPAKETASLSDQLVNLVKSAKAEASKTR